MKWLIPILLFVAGCASDTPRSVATPPTAVAPKVLDTPGQKTAEPAEPAEQAEAEDEADAEYKKETPKPKVVKKRTTKRAKKRQTLKPAVLRVVTNFDKADVTVNGLAYPEYIKPGETDGMVIPAGGPHRVRVTFDGKEKNYEIRLRPYETRLLFVELTGFGGSSKPAPAPAKKKAVKETKKKEEPKEEKKDDPGKITVYSKPAGTVMIDGKSMGERTPATVEVENGRHEVQVQYEGSDISEKKIVRVRNGSRIKLFFRERKN